MSNRDLSNQVWRFLRAAIAVIALMSLGAGQSYAATPFPFPTPTFSNAPVPATPPDTIDATFTTTTIANNANVTFAGASFVSADAGKLITCSGLGTAGIDQARYHGKISTVVNATSLTLSPAPTLAMTATPQTCSYGSDRTASIQAALTAGAKNGLGSYIPGGHYLVSFSPASSFTINAPGSGYTASATGTLTWTGSGCTTPPVINVDTNAAGQIADFLGVATGPVCSIPPSWSAATWTPSSSLGAGGGATFYTTALKCLQPPNVEALHFPGALCNGTTGNGSIITLVSPTPISSLMTFGDTANGQYLDRNEIMGLTLDCNFAASYCADLPNGLSTKVTIAAKNQILADIRYGNYNAGTLFDGSQTVHTKLFRDYYEPFISSISYGSTTTVTTPIDNGFSTGRIVTFDPQYQTHGPSQLFASNFIITVTGPRTFTLNNTNSSGWASITGVIGVSENMPGTPFPIAISGISVGATTTVTTALATGYPNGSLICIYNVGGTSQVDGPYTAATVSGATITIATATSGTPVVANAYVILCPQVNVAAAPVPVGILYENAADIYAEGVEGYGFVIGMFTGDSWAHGGNYGGFDGSYIGNHLYNYSTNGVMYTGYLVGGHNAMVRDHTDCPALFAFNYTGYLNDQFSGEMDCEGWPTTPNNQSNFIRLEFGAAVAAYGGHIVTGIGQSVLSTVSAPGTAAGSTADGSLYGDVTNYTQFGMGLNQGYTTYQQPDTVEGALYAANSTGPAIINSYGVNGSINGACDFTTGHVGLYMAAGATGSTLVQNDNKCAYKRGEFFFPLAGGITAVQLLGLDGPFSVAGTPLPACTSGIQGSIAFVIDATARSTTYTGGGSVIDSVLCNGSTWLTQ